MGSMRMIDLGKASTSMGDALREESRNFRIVFRLIDKFLSNQETDLLNERVFSKRARFLVELDNSTIQGHLIGFSKLLSGLNFNSDLLLELCHVDFECINFFIPLGKLFVSLGFFIVDGFLVDSLLEPLVRDSSPAAK